MQRFYFRLFFRVISKNREVYGLKIITLAIAFACTLLILLFSLNEFGYDRFHKEAGSVFRVLQKNSGESVSGNRISNRIPSDIFKSLEYVAVDSMVVSRVKVMNETSIHSDVKKVQGQKIHAVDGVITDIFTFEFVSGSAYKFRHEAHTVVLSVSASQNYFGTTEAVGKKIKISTLNDTVEFSIAGVFKDFPRNTHEDFNVLIRFDPASIQTLNFDPEDTGVYGRVLHGTLSDQETNVNGIVKRDKLIYFLQPLPKIYFGPRVTGEDARHGDQYSILILICITTLILFLALTSFINLTTLTLPYRAKEMAIKKIAGTSQLYLIFSFALESVVIVGISFSLGILLLLLSAGWTEGILSIKFIPLLLNGDVRLIGIMTVLFLVLVSAPLLLILRFARATPNRLLSTETITFPRFKRIITFLQLGISLFLIAASMVIKRQINYSLVKEPGRNYDQIVYMRYPSDMTRESLNNIRAGLKMNNANVVDVMASSQLPDRIGSKELNSQFYTMGVDPLFKDFFGLEIVRGNWFKANDGDSIVVVNEIGMQALGADAQNVIGVFRDMSGQFNQPQKPVKINMAPYFKFNFLCIRILEVDIRRTLHELSDYFGGGTHTVSMNFLDKRFEEWLNYQDRLNKLSEVLTIISALLSCCAIYGLCVSLVRDKLKQIAIHKVFGAKTQHITAMLIREFATQMLFAILIFGPITYIVINELLRSFVYHTHFIWFDPMIPLAYCGLVITILCGLQAMSLDRSDLTSALKG